MSTKLHLKEAYIGIIALLTFFFFVSPALSPAVGGMTIYLHWFIPFLDIDYVAYLYSNIIQRINRRYLICFLVFVTECVFFIRLFTIVRIFTMVLSLSYLSYAKKYGLFRYMYLSFNINIIIAILQFVLFYINRSWAYTLGPTKVAGFIWGKYATKTYSNMYSIWGNSLIRVCGWSREAGFFASLLIAILFCYMNDNTIKKNRAQYLLYAIGFVISLSKMSLLIIPLIIIWILRRYLNKIPMFFCYTAYIMATTLVANLLNDIGYFLERNESITHRFIGYHVVWQLPLRQFLLGFSSINSIDVGVLYRNPMLLNLGSKDFDLCGWSYLVQLFGIGGILLLLVILLCLKVNTSGCLIFMLMTFSVSPLTATSFVVLAFWLALDISTYNNLSERTVKKTRCRRTIDQKYAWNGGCS